MMCNTLLGLNAALKQQQTKNSGRPDFCTKCTVRFVVPYIMRSDRDYERKKKKLSPTPTRAWRGLSFFFTLTVGGDRKQTK